MRIIVTGGNGDTGRATASTMVAARSEVVITSRNLSKEYEAVKTMPGDVDVRELDLADHISVRKLAGTDPDSSRRRWELSAQLTGPQWQGEL